MPKAMHRALKRKGYSESAAHRIMNAAKTKKKAKRKKKGY